MIEYFIYTHDPTPIEIAKFKQTMREAGWIMHVICGWLGTDLLNLPYWGPVFFLRPPRLGWSVFWSYGRKNEENRKARG